MAFPRNYTEAEELALHLYIGNMFISWNSYFSIQSLLHKE